MSHDTGNDIESNDILDFEDNCENLDVLMNADQDYWTDRLGNKRPTIDYALRMVGFTPAGFDFTTGGVLKNGDRNKCVFNQADQTWYSWSGDLPYNVIAGSTPGEGWKPADDRSLRTELGNFLPRITSNELKSLNYPLGKIVVLTDLSDSKWHIVSGKIVNDTTIRQAGGGKQATLILEDGMDIESFGVSEVATPETNLKSLAAAVRSEIFLTSKQKTYVIGTGSIAATIKYLNWRANGTVIKLQDGNKDSALFVLNGGKSYYLCGMTWDGNRENVSGNNAGFFVVTNCSSFVAENTRFENLRRYGYNIVGKEPHNSNVKIFNLYCDNIGMLSELKGGPVGEQGALGEAIKCENVRNLTIDGFEVKNTSGTGDGQVQKAFYCVNVKITNVDLDSVGPSLTYPAISNVRNRNIICENINILGPSQVCIEDNSNLSCHYKNVVTYGRKACIMGSDGAELTPRYIEKVTIENWDDTSTEEMSFNLLAIKLLTLKNVVTNKNINISRDGVQSDRRSRNLTLMDVTCTNLSTMLTEGYLQLNNCNVLGLWTNTHRGTAVDNNSTIYSYTDSGEVETQLLRIGRDNERLTIAGTLPPGGSKTFKLPKSVSNSPLVGKITATNYFGSSLATQWSQIEWSFYDAGQPSVNKNVVMTGAIARSSITLTVSSANRTVTFTNNEPSDSTTLVGSVLLLNKTLFIG